MDAVTVKLTGRLEEVTKLPTPDLEVSEDILILSARSAYARGYADALEFALALHDRPERSSAPKPTLMTENQLIVLRAGMDHDINLFNSINGRAIGSMLRNHCITLQVSEDGKLFPVLSPKGAAIAAEHGIVRTEHFIELPDKLLELDIDKTVTLTKSQVEAITIAAEGNKKNWSLLHGKTTNGVVRSGWVHVAANGVPSVTLLGMAVAVLNEIELHGQHVVPRAISAAKAAPLVVAPVKRAPRANAEEDFGEGVGVVVGSVSGPAVVR
jgi:hypothetical protein